MEKQFLMGNEAIALGAVHAGLNLATGYPGTPSTEILETVAKLQSGNLYVEWSVNEKAALEVAAGAAYCGARTLVTMKQVGLNVASDPLMSLAYLGVKGAMVVVVADDPGPISSQTEQDTRNFAQYAKLPVFDPSTPEEAYGMIREAFEYSEKYGTPVLFRPTTRVSHAYTEVEVYPSVHPPVPEGFIKDTARYVIFPRTSYLNHQKLFARERVLSEDFSSYERNFIAGSGTLGIVSSGVSYGYVREAVGDLSGVRLMKISTPYPFPEALACSFLSEVTRVLVCEELDPVIERELLFLCGKHGIKMEVRGKLTGDLPCAGEYSADIVCAAVDKFLLREHAENPAIEKPELPKRPPVLCAGCPHRASFFHVKEAMKNRKAVFCGDIGCYTLGNAKPLDMVDTCLCMGADVTVAQGIRRIEPDTVCFSFIGDSTFFASGMTGVANAVYNGTKIVLIVLDNATTAMTGHQEHPGTGRTILQKETEALHIPSILSAMGVKLVCEADPFNREASMDAVKKAADFDGVSAVIFRSPCIAGSKKKKPLTVSASCTGCGRCEKLLGCPALTVQNKKAVIDPETCTGCGLCATVCPFSAIERGEA